ncbi:MAG: hypothetical protein ABIZ91_08745 [Gemmatimonadaceae bacterium]
MFKIVLILCIGFAAGYSFGFQDAQEHTEPIVTRTLERAGGSTRGKYNQDLDGTMDRLEKR